MQGHHHDASWRWGESVPARPERGRGLSRRLFVAGVLGLGASVALPPGRAGAADPLGTVRPREDWAGGLAPRGQLPVEAPRDVRFLLLHHSASPNDYAPGDVPGILRSFYHHHTGNKGWADIAYNFLVDRYGTVWEGRAGSLRQPVMGDATGGSQGFALLACFVGDHSSQPPTAEAVEAMAGLFAGLARRYGIDASPRARASFTSRGSNRHPAGTRVTTATVAGHRDMSDTACPGDAAYALVAEALPARVATVAAGLAGPSGAGSLVARPVPSGGRHSPATWPDRVADRAAARRRRWSGRTRP